MYFSPLNENTKFWYFSNYIKIQIYSDFNFGINTIKLYKNSDKIHIYTCIRIIILYFLEANKNFGNFFKGEIDSSINTFSHTLLSLFSNFNFNPSRHFIKNQSFPTFLMFKKIIFGFSEYYKKQIKKALHIF